MEAPERFQFSAQAQVQEAMLSNQIVNKGLKAKCGLALVPLLVVAVAAPQSASAADKVRVLTEYEPRGQVEKVSQPHRLGEVIRWTDNHYDGLDRLLRVTYGDGTRVTNRYFPGENFLSVETTDQGGHRRQTHFDAFGNEIHRDRFSDVVRLRTSYQYDALDRLIEIRDPNKSSFWYAYDGHGNKTFEVDPNLGCRDRNYDLAGRLNLQRSAIGATVSYTYDPLGRVNLKVSNKDALQFSNCRFEIVIGNNTINGSGSNDNLDAGRSRLSDVQLSGGAGNDTYLIQLRSGHVTIPSSAEATTGGSDTIKFLDLDLEDLTLTIKTDSQNGDWLVFAWDKHGYSGSLRVAHRAARIEKFTFADGGAARKIALIGNGRVQIYAADPGEPNKMLGSRYDDYLFGSTGPDVLDAGSGTRAHLQHLRGEAGDDLYLIGRNAGNVHLNYHEGEGDGTDTVRFKDLNLSDIAVSVMDYTTGNPDHVAGVQLRLSWNTGDGSGELRIDHMGRFIERFEFADGTSVSQVSIGTGNRPRFFGTDGNDFIHSTDHDDFIHAGKGNDVLDPGAGLEDWQHLWGEEGDDVYLIGKDAGDVWMMIAGEGADQGNDVVRFKDLLLTDVQMETFEFSGQGYVLKFSWAKDGNVGRLQIGDLAQHIERFEFADGTSVAGFAFGTHDRMEFSGTPGDDLIVGTWKNDIIHAGEGDDLLDPGPGADHWQHLWGENGNDTYRIGKQAGNVWMMAAGEGAGQGTDTVLFKDLVLSDLTIEPISVPNVGEVLKFSWNKDGHVGRLQIGEMGAHIERFEFADGTSISGLIFGTNDRVHFYGTPANDILLGTVKDDIIYAGNGDDILDPGSGAGGWQHLWGEDGNDTYRIGKDADNVWMMATGEGAGQGTDTVLFKDLALSDLTIEPISVPNVGEVLKFSWNRDGHVGRLQVADMGAHIERFEFEDGTSVSGIAFGTNDRIHYIGTAADDIMFGTARDEIIHAGAGDDILDPGAGAGDWQHLWGEEGDDTYRIGKDAGNVWMMKAGEGPDQGTDTVVFKDLGLAEVTIETFAYSGEGEVLKFSWNKDGHVGRLQIGELGQQIERFEFADGAVHTAQELWP